MPINYLDNVNITGTLSATLDVSTGNRFISGGQDVYNVISQTACNVSVYCLGIGGGSVLPNTLAGNTSSGSYSTIINGTQNRALSTYTTIINGNSNTASGNYSFIAGGSANDTRGFTNTFILGTALSATQANYTYVNNLSSKNYINTLVLSTSSLQVASVSSTTAPVGTVTAKMPIYNATGTFIGYIPIYTS